MFKNIVRAIYVIIPLIFAILLIYICMVCFSLSNYTNQNMMTFDDDGQYYQTIKSSIDNMDELNLSEIFTFKWEKAYVVPANGMSGKELAKRIGVSCNILPNDPSTPALSFVFYNKEKVVYEYIYDSDYLKFEPLDSIISNESAVFVVTKKGKPIILQSKESINKD